MKGFEFGNSGAHIINSANLYQNTVNIREIELL